jgi:hypothetical protein
MSHDLIIQQGKTFSVTLRWETGPLIYKAVTAITSTLPCRVTATGHDIPDGWRVALTGVKGMTDINASTIPPKDKDFYDATVVDANTVELNAVDSTRFKAYTSGGYLVSNTPVNLTGYTARMKIKDKIGGTVLASTEAGDTPLDIITVTIDTAAKTITVTISATDTAALTWTKGVYDLEMISAGGVVTELIDGTFTVSKEVTT